jgi:hypothetical protein
MTLRLAGLVARLVLQFRWVDLAVFQVPILQPPWPLVYRHSHPRLLVIYLISLLALPALPIHLHHLPPARTAVVEAEGIAVLAPVPVRAQAVPVPVLVVVVNYSNNLS